MAEQTDKLAIRFIYIITKLNQGETLSVQELAEEFQVSKRVIQKDLNERIKQFLPISKKDGRYFLDSHIVGKLGYEDIKNFAILSGIQKLYPSLEETFLSDILNKNINKSYLVKEEAYEDISTKRSEFALIQLAIVLKKQLIFIYKNKQRIVNPYKLVNTNNIWYLVGDEDSILKTYSFTKISSLSMQEISFKPNKEFLEIINKNELNWFSQKSIKVVLSIDAKVGEYFLRRDLFPNQTILKNTAKELILQTKISYEDEILRVVRYWIPHVKILEPEYLQEKLLQELQKYLNT